MPVNHQVHKNIDKNVNSVSLYEIKGNNNKLYCQNLSLIAKLFLDHKSIYFDVSPFNFYVLTENDDKGPHVVGYFSKEISLKSDYNLACIMVLPPYQKNGYGQFLISFSYYLSKKENKISTPEVPLSDLGKIAYRSYWTLTLADCLIRFKGNLSLKELTELTGIKHEDIIYALNEIGLIKYWKGQQVLQSINLKQLEDYIHKKREKKTHYITFNSNFLK
jgi:histone acetyltransferase MYST1